MRHEPPPPPPRPSWLPDVDLTVLRTIFKVGEDACGGPVFPHHLERQRTRQESELLLRILCSTARTFVNEKWFARWARCPSERRYQTVVLVQALAAVDPDEFIQACREEFPEDDFAARLSPFEHSDDGWWS